MAFYPITPVPKPRQTKSDKWKKRACVLRYREFADKLRESGAKLPESGGQILFWIPMPESWSEKKKLTMDGTPHQQKPDLDNLVKAVLDALYGDDCVIWDIRASKRWCREGGIFIS